MREDLAKYLLSFPHRLIVIYGSRGSGKTVLCLQLAEESRAFIALPSRKRDIDKLGSFNVRRNLLRIFEEDNPSSSLKAVVDALMLRDSFSVAIFDDIFPITFLVEREPSWLDVRDCGLIISLLSLLLSYGKTVVITVHEHGSLPLPRRWRMFVELGSILLRLRRKFRVRELQLVSVDDLPKLGELWLRNQVVPKISYRRLMLLKLVDGPRFIVLPEG